MLQSLPLGGTVLLICANDVLWLMLMLVYPLHLFVCTVHLPAGVSLAAAGIDTLWQGVM